jgi:hypothetical protein
MKKILFSMALLLSVLVVAGTVAGCSKKKATVLTEGQKLVIIDNTLGEGVKNNIKLSPTYESGHKTEALGVIRKLAATDTEPEKYFAYIRQDGGTTGNKWADITNVQNGANVSHLALIETIPANTALLPTATDNASIDTFVKYSYQVKGSSLHVWGDRVLTVTINCPELNPTPFTFTINLDNTFKITHLLGHAGDSATLTDKDGDKKLI